MAANTSENVKKVLVRTSLPNSAQARLVAAQFGVDVTVSAVDLGPGVDVVVGNKFKGLVAGVPTTLTYTDEQEVCSSSTTSSPTTSPTTTASTTSSPSS